MPKRNVDSRLVRLALGALVVAVGAYWLQPLDPRFEILMVAAAIAFIWLSTVLVFIWLRYLIEEDDV
jgi:hypothetical protein